MPHLRKRNRNYRQTSILGFSTGMRGNHLRGGYRKDSSSVSNHSKDINLGSKCTHSKRANKRKKHKKLPKCVKPVVGQVPVRFMPNGTIISSSGQMQGVAETVLLSQCDLLAVANSCESVMSSTSFNKYTMIRLNRCHGKIKFANYGDSEAAVTVYELLYRKDTNESALENPWNTGTAGQFLGFDGINILVSGGFWKGGLSTASAPGISFAGWNNTQQVPTPHTPGITPFASPELCSFMRVTGVNKFCISPGGQHEHSFNWHLAYDINLDVINGVNGTMLGKLSRQFLIVTTGQLGYSNILGTGVVTGSSSQYVVAEVPTMINVRLEYQIDACPLVGEVVRPMYFSASQSISDVPAANGWPGGNSFYLQNESVPSTNPQLVKIT
nr:MAG: capsid protein [Cressdnaviricota sp.]